MEGEIEEEATKDEAALAKSVAEEEDTNEILSFLPSHHYV